MFWWKLKFHLFYLFKGKGRLFWGLKSGGKVLMLNLFLPQSLKSNLLLGCCAAAVLCRWLVWLSLEFLFYFFIFAWSFQFFIVFMLLFFQVPINIILTARRYWKIWSTNSAKCMLSTFFWTSYAGKFDAIFLPEANRSSLLFITILFWFHFC